MSPQRVRVPLAHEVMVHGGGGEQTRDRGAMAVHAAIGQDDDVGTIGDGPAGAPTQLVHRARESFAALSGDV
jgi:hypothetical protein